MFDKNAPKGTKVQNAQEEQIQSQQAASEQETFVADAQQAKPKKQTANKRKVNPLNKLLSKIIGSIVKPKQACEISPDVLAASSEDKETPLVCYAMQETSFTNSALLNFKTTKNNIPAALAKMTDTHVSEKSAIITLQHRPKGLLPKKNTKATYSQRLYRLVEAAKQQQRDILIIPVSIHWGRDPRVESSLFKVLFSEDWGPTSFLRQLVNIFAQRNNTYVHFHDGINLQQQLADAPEDAAMATQQLETQLNKHIDEQRTVILGPDLSDTRTEVTKLLGSQAIQYAVQKEAIVREKSEAKMNQKAHGYLREIASDYSSAVVRVFERILEWLWTKLYDGVEVHHFEGVDENSATDPTSLRVLAQENELIFVPCHRSHIDYLLTIYVLYIRGLRTPYIAAGDNLNLPGLGKILRGGGAFFLRRSFKGNALYTAVFREYLHNIVQRNIPMMFFPEGGRSRSGRLLQPKTGMMAMTVHSRLRSQSGKPIVYVPMYLGYERVAEGATYIGEMKGAAKEKESIGQLLKALRKIERIFGVVHVNFGEPVHLKDVLDKHNVDDSVYSPDRNDEPLQDDVKKAVNNIAIKTMQNINKAAVLNPVCLLSLVLLSTPKHAMTEAALEAQLNLYRRLANKVKYDERTVITEMTGQEIIEYGIRLKHIQRLPHVLGNIISVNTKEAQLLTYFRNNIFHLFALPSMVSVLIHENGRIDKHIIIKAIEQMYPFLQGELFLKWKQHQVTEVVENIIASLVEEKLIAIDTDGMLLADVPDTLNHHQLSIIAAPVQQSLKRYVMALALMNQQGSGTICAERTVNLCHLLGQRMSVLFEHESPELFDKAIFRDFIGSLQRSGFISEDENKQLVFDERLSEIAQNAHYVLSGETLDTLKQLANVSQEELNAAIEALDSKKKKRFSRKNKKAANKVDNSKTDASKADSNKTATDDKQPSEINAQEAQNSQDSEQSQNLEKTKDKA